MKTYLFENTTEAYIAISSEQLSDDAVTRLCWLLQAEPGTLPHAGHFVGARREMVSPWSTNATEIARNVGIASVARIERFVRVSEDAPYDRMTEMRYEELSNTTLTVDAAPQAVKEIEDIAAFNEEFGLALSEEEITYLQAAADKRGRLLSDAEVFAFGQINSEHCRHKIFNGAFRVDGELQERSLFALIKETTAASGSNVVSAYKDNVAFLKGPRVTQFYPTSSDGPACFSLRKIPSVISLKAETHNFPTTVEPFNGASTGGGGEIRDRMAGGVGSLPLTGTAVYMTANPRWDSNDAAWSPSYAARSWKYQRPEEILVKASNGASDFGNKFGQPLITGSVLTFEGQTSRGFFGFDRCIMLAGGVGYAHAEHAQKREAKAGDVVVVLGGDNYRIGLGGGAVSSVDTGDVSVELELSAVQRANPEMQKRAYNVIRALCEESDNPVLLIHDHGAGGHINCLSELLEDTGGKVELAALPRGDETLSVLELIANESQERMGLIVPQADVERLKRIAERERAPMYVVGVVGDDKQIVFEDTDGSTPVNLSVDTLFGSTPQLQIDATSERAEQEAFVPAIRDVDSFLSALHAVFELEAVACKDWLTNKVDRSVSGHVALQQCCGPLHLPLNDVAVTALDYVSHVGIASSIGHAPVVGLLDERAGARLSIAEALTNIVFAPLEDGLSSVALSANWMWPAKQPGEDARLYRACEAVSDFSKALGIPVPTGKDSLSMTMKYADGQDVRAPGTVVISASAPVSDVRRAISADLRTEPDSEVFYLNFSGVKQYPLGASALAQISETLGAAPADVVDVERFRASFAAVQAALNDDLLLAGHDISAGGLITALCEMAFAGDCGLEINIASNMADETASMLFCEKPGVLLQVAQANKKRFLDLCGRFSVTPEPIARVISGKDLILNAGDLSLTRSVSELRAKWYRASWRLERMQTAQHLADERRDNLGRFPLEYTYPASFTGMCADVGVTLERTEASGLRAAIIREKGTNGDREMAFAMYAAGFDVLDITMSDLMHGRHDLSDVRFVVFPGGFSNSDVLGAARGWAGAFKFNDRAFAALENFFKREDTLSLGVCNGCQLMVELGLLGGSADAAPRMAHNDSGKFESVFVNVRVEESNAIMLKPLVGSQLGIWVAHGEGKFLLPTATSHEIPMRYISSAYPANPNGSDENAAALCSADGRHLVMMPHLERSVFPWHWPHISFSERRHSEITPWMLAFTAAAEWIRER